jgi:enediyne biosynthesis protein E4
VTDLGSDGTLDLYATNITDPNDQFGTGSGNTLLVGQRGADGTLTYVDDASAAGLQDTGWGWGTAFTDLDLDGNLDLYVVQGMQEFIAQQSPELRNGKARLFLGTATHGFTEAADDGCDLPGDQRSVIPLDYDRDGAPDLLITQVAYSTVLLENGSAGKHWLTVDLSRAGAQAAGARVTVGAGGARTTQVALYGGSYLAGMPMELYFGLGAASSADEVTITWADGTVLELGPTAGDRLLHVTPAGVQ